MLTLEQSAAIFDRIREYSSADEVELLISGNRFALTRFANNAIHQNVADENQMISVRTNFGGRTARATTNKLDEDSLRRVVESSENLAEVQQPDADLLPMPSANEHQRTPRKRSRDNSAEPLFYETAAITPELAPKACARWSKSRARHKLTTAGVFSSAESVEGIFNSSGLHDWHEQTFAEISITMLARKFLRLAKSQFARFRQLDPVTPRRDRSAESLDPRDPLDLGAGKYTVILEPAAVLDIVGFMFWDFGGQAILDERSFLNNRIGTQLFGANINIWDDVAHPLQAGAPFDGEGMRAAIAVHRKWNRETTHLRARHRGKNEEIGIRQDCRPRLPRQATAFLPNEMGEMPVNIVFAPPDNPKTVEQMISETERGVLVTRLWYIREVDPYEKILTGMTRDGTFLVENGKVQRGVRNFRFNESLISMLSNVEAMSTPVRSSGEESFDMVVPAMKVREFNFTEVTKF